MFYFINYFAVEYRTKLLKTDESFYVSHPAEVVDDIVKYEFILIDGELKETVAHTVNVLEHQGYNIFKDKL